MLKPISFLQRRFIIGNARNLGLEQELQGTEGDLDHWVREKGNVEVNHTNYAPFSLGVKSDGQTGIQTSYHPPFTDALQARLPDEEFDHLVENGFTPHSFSNNRELVFSLAFERSRRGVSFSIPFGLALDVFDFNTQDKLVGTFMAKVSPQSGIMGDEFAEYLNFYSAFDRYLESLGIKSWKILDEVWPTRIKLAKFEYTAAGPIYVNFSIAPDYRHKGQNGFSTISQILLSTAARLAAEQFFCRAYAAEPVEGEGAKLIARYLKPRQPVQVGQITGEAFSLIN